ncbi:hypothetical protein NBG4_400003 [Candidatus Sulfobium mesophilum]|jgi:hypothetical protein|uniref:Uncharacterized protein n=1 Tax=Candidatus Sulfobium mesophilum TaxID=2016548 RepID=A0A2U3QI39_9BACT|nr:hypothetical protein NBG4_400003 [Candidatus Sulfobium mesophilum]
MFVIPRLDRGIQKTLDARIKSEHDRNQIIQLLRDRIGEWEMKGGEAA